MRNHIIGFSTLGLIAACGSTPVSGDTTPSSTPASGYARIEPGRFAMGSPPTEEGRGDTETQQEVAISRAFLLKSTEVTQGEWRALMGTNPSMYSRCGDTCPVERVSWYEAVAYLNALSAREGLEPCYDLRACEGHIGGGCDIGRLFCDGDYSCSEVQFAGPACTGYRLPTAAEWEYAARAGTTAAQYGPLDSIAWYGGNSSDEPKPVGKKSPNAWGLYDMLGNVWELVNDQDHGNGMSAGGSWAGDMAQVRAANRFNIAPKSRNGFVGFRPARTIQ